MAGLTAAVWVGMYATRLSYLSRHRIDPQKLTTRNAAGELLAPVNRVAENFQNLLEVPVLFYALIALLLATDAADARFTQLAWAYVLLRAVHSAVHVSYNRVVHRFAAYAASCLVLGFMWARFAWMVWAAG